MIYDPNNHGGQSRSRTIGRKPDPLRSRLGSFSKARFFGRTKGDATCMTEQGALKWIDDACCIDKVCRWRTLAVKQSASKEIYAGC